MDVDGTLCICVMVFMFFLIILERGKTSEQTPKKNETSTKRGVVNSVPIFGDTLYMRKNFIIHGPYSNNGFMDGRFVYINTNNYEIEKEVYFENNMKIMETLYKNRKEITCVKYQNEEPYMTTEYDSDGKIREVVYNNTSDKEVVYNYLIKPHTSLHVKYLDGKMIYKKITYLEKSKRVRYVLDEDCIKIQVKKDNTVTYEQAQIKNSPTILVKKPFGNTYEKIMVEPLSKDIKYKFEM